MTFQNSIQCGFLKFNPKWPFKIQSNVAFQMFSSRDCCWSSLLWRSVCFKFSGGGLCMQKQSGERGEVAKTWDALALSRPKTLEWRFARACIIMHKSFFYVNPDVVARFFLEVSRVLSTIQPARAGIYRNPCCRQKRCHRMPWDQKTNFLVNNIALY